MILTVPVDEPGHWWPTLGPQVCDFIEQNLVFGPGDLRGQPAVLDDEKRAFLYRLYEVYPPSHEQAGRRRFKRAGLSLRKGTAKTEFAAWIAAVELHAEGPVRCTGWTAGGEPIGGPVSDPYIPLVAYTEEQSEELAYGALRVILEQSLLADDFDIGLERIERKKGGGKAVPLATAPDARDGARTTFQHFDEPLALDTPVPTPSGWKTVGEIRPGDFVYGRTGEAVRVAGVSGVKHGRPCYRVTFENGHSVIADGSHVWTATDWGNRPAGERQVTTEGMLAAGVDTGYGWRWRLPRANGWDGKTASLPVDPYLLGLWLGDGATDAGYIHNAPDDYASVSQGVAHTVSNDARQGVIRWLPVGLRSVLRSAGILGHKRIPAQYLFASRGQRLALLQGLMDTDGYTSPAGGCTFVQKRRELAEDVALLVRSLGCGASVVESLDERSKTGSMCKVHFSPAFPPFRLPRKRAAATWQERRCTTRPAIVSIEPVESVPVCCIGVESDDHLFLVGHGVHLTHNTHRFTLPRLVRAHRTMLANVPKRFRADAWSLETTTAPEPGTGSVAEATMEYARAVADGRVRDSRLFYFHRQAGEHDLTTEAGLHAAVREASGPVAEWSDLEGIVDQFRDPTADRAYLERVWLNRLVQSSSQAFDVPRWRELARPGTEVARGALIVFGLDGSLFHDATAIVATEVATGYQWLAGLWERPIGLKPDDAWKVPDEEVDATVADLFERFTVWRFYADPPYWRDWIKAWTAKFGEDRVVEWWTNRRRQMAEALRAYDTAMKTGAVTHSGDANLTRHIANARREDLPARDEQGKPLWIIRKERADSPLKMDAAMAGCLAWEARNDAIAANALEQSGPSVYETRGLTSVGVR